MLTLKKLEVDGFGPFAEPQVLTFPSKPGVTVIYGENMRGKTTLLNAIRYAFFGTVLGRARGRNGDPTPTKLHTISNRDRAAEGQYGFSVSLTFDYDGQEYELVRACVPRRGVTTPASDNDYDQDVMLRRGTAPLGPQERERALQQIFPAEVSRFFLFDGELLQEYEELLINESDAGRKISDAIERILGVPILTRGRAHLTQLADDADKQAAKEAQKSQETKQIGVALESATQAKAAHQEERGRLQKQLEEFTAQKLEIERYLQTVQKYSALLEESDKSGARLDAAAIEEKAARGDLQRAMGDAWRSLLREPVKSARAAAQADAQQQVASLVLSLRAKALEEGRCGTCEQDVAPAARQRLAATLPKTQATEKELSSAMSRLGDLAKFNDRDNAGEVRELWKRCQRLQLEQVALKDRLADLKVALSDSDPETLRRSKASYGEVHDKIGVVKRAIEDTHKKEEESDLNIQRLRKKLENLGTGEFKAGQIRAKLLRDSAEVFHRAVEAYKNDLRARVEATASKLFLSMTTEKEDYAGLTINLGYGLTIRHRDGIAEEARSAGAEHVVALALMGALQNNAPLRGPIVMDSPFGRLDDKHTSNVIQTLPEMAGQVILLVYEAEVKGMDRVRKLLKNKLVREYQLERVSGRRTNVREIK